MPKIISVPEKHKETLNLLVSSVLGGAAHKLEETYTKRSRTH